ncbi:MULTISPECIES: hypothetical protein [Stenotrophomonas]|nr:MULTISPECIES: hypothetical protein [Stenotrophomonas]MBH1746270.1 hypothetical protein [Stenotrophomonas maltophilia]MBH1864493.1 hypothetical protein [Stenotrophomonas maltophilia]MDH1388291.1 hypothetical protein [Stenotrophomonas sp. GD03701]MDH1392930.1 hypothetical protein [Stenotrophomonas sp. GD03702]MDQ7303967.1 hypothetical protein [Stenotrophomonas sp. Sm0581]
MQSTAIPTAQEQGPLEAVRLAESNGQSPRPVNPAPWVWNFGFLAWTQGPRTGILAFHSTRRGHAMLKPIITGLLGTSLSATAAPTGALSLEETFDAYVRVVTQDDERARTALRESLQTASKHAFPGIGDTVDALHIHQGPALGSNDPIAMAVKARWHSIHCKEVERADSGSPDRVTIRYHCGVPDVSSFFATYREHREQFVAVDAVASIQPAKMAFAQVLTQAPNSTFDTTAEFFRAGEGGPWASTDMMFLGLALLQKMLPFREWNERIEAESITARTGIPACDLLLDARLKAARIHDSVDPSSDDATFQNVLEETVSGMGPDEARAHCRALQERHRP